jgi:hypothetical protein
LHGLGGLSISRALDAVSARHPASASAQSSSTSSHCGPIRFLVSKDFSNKLASPIGAKFHIDDDPRVLAIQIPRDVVRCHGARDLLSLQMCTQFKSTMFQSDKDGMRFKILLEHCPQPHAFPDISTPVCKHHRRDAGTPRQKKDRNY